MEVDPEEEGESDYSSVGGELAGEAVGKEVGAYDGDALSASDSDDTDAVSLTETESDRSAPMDDSWAPGWRPAPPWV